MRDTITIARDDLKVLVREAVREELQAVGLRTNDPERADEVREDLRFLRRLRTGAGDAAGKVGMAVILFILGGGMTALWLGFKAIVSKQ